MSEEMFFAQLKQRMKDYDEDYNGARKRSEEIAAEDRIIAVKRSNDLNALERFGVIM